MKYYYHKGVFGLLYAIRLSDKWISIVNSETLEHHLYSYKEVYQMLLDGKYVNGLYVSKIFTDEETKESLSLSKECLTCHGGITRAGSLPVGYSFVKPEEPVPVSLSTTTDTDLSVELDNVIIFRDEHYYYVWYDNCCFEVWGKDVASFYFLNGKLVVGYKDYHSVDACYIENYVKVVERYDCTRSQFKRKCLLR